MEIKRALDLHLDLKEKSCFLLGPRQTGKTTFLKHLEGQPFFVQLLDVSLQRKLIQNPSFLKEYIPATAKLVIIDEIQKIPELLDLVHLLIEEKKIRFILTGSSARKLHKGKTNLLGGRARVRHLFPFTVHELGSRFDLIRAINFGLMPSIYFSESPVESLRDYASEYLIQEISAEGIARNIPAFSRFLEVAARCNGQIINYEGIGSDAEVKRGTVQNYFQILEDTLIGFRLNPWKKSKNRKAILTDKFYFFDIGVVNSLTETHSVSVKSPQLGPLFEPLVINEVRAWNEYKRKNTNLTYWKSTSNFEVDLLINEEIAIEIKAKEVISKHDLRGLDAIAEEKKIKKRIIVYLGKYILRKDNVDCYPLAVFSEKLWGGELG